MMSMASTYLVAFVVSAVVSVVLTALLRRLAIARGWFDLPSEARKVHTRPIPRIGGVAVAIAFFVPVLALSLGHGLVADPDPLLGLLGGAAVLVIVGLVDDLVGLSAWQKLPLQVLAAVFAYSQGLQIHSIGNPFGAPIELGWLALPVTLVWIVGVTNAINLIDGLDGLAAGVSLFAVLTLFVLAIVNGNAIVGLTAIALAGALLGFLWHNFNPASIFMGDGGSLFLGYTLATTAIWGSTKSSTVVSLLIPLLCLGLPIADTSLAILRRVARGRPMFSPDRDHIHHKLLARGMSPRRTVLTLYGAAALLALAALGLELGNGVDGAMVLTAVGVVSLAASRAFGIVSVRRAARAVRYGLLRKRRTFERMRLLSEIGGRMRHARSLEELRDLLFELSAALDVGGMRCAVELEGWREQEPRRGYEWTWQRPGGAAGPDAVAQAGGVVLAFPLDGRDGALTVSGTLAFWWSCPSPVLQIPEQPLYEWLAVVVRERVLAVVREAEVRASQTAGATVRDQTCAMQVE